MRLLCAWPLAWALTACAPQSSSRPAAPDGEAVVRPPPVVQRPATTATVDGSRDEGLTTDTTARRPGGPTSGTSAPFVGTNTGSASSEGTEDALAADASPSAPAGGTAIIDDDEVEQVVVPAAKAPQLPASLESLTEQQIRQRLRQDPTSLGPLSVGWTNAGALVSGVQLPASDHYTVMEPVLAWGTQETVDYLRRAIEVVHETYPDTPPMFVGHLSRQSGGYLKPHKSHQSGRDVDTSFYYQSHHRNRWYSIATAKTLDRARTWTFLRALLTETDVQMIFINTSVQRLLKEHALKIGEDPAWLDQVFQYKSRHPSPIIRHARGHHTHIHIRFYNPVAQEMGRRAYAPLVALGKIKPQRYYLSHRARKGDTLGSLARRYRTTVKEIQAANKLQSTKIFAKKIYLIPKQGGVRPAPPRVSIPPRRLPPAGTPRPRSATAPSAPTSTATPSAP